MGNIEKTVCVTCDIRFAELVFDKFGIFYAENYRNSLLCKQTRGEKLKLCFRACRLFYACAALLGNFTYTRGDCCLVKNGKIRKIYIILPRVTAFSLTFKFSIEKAI